MRQGASERAVLTPHHKITGKARGSAPVPPGDEEVTQHADWATAGHLPQGAEDAQLRIGHAHVLAQQDGLTLQA